MPVTLHAGINYLDTNGDNLWQEHIHTHIILYTYNSYTPMRIKPHPSWHCNEAPPSCIIMHITLISHQQYYKDFISLVVHPCS